MKKIIVPTDMSPHTKFVNKYAFNLAAILDAEIICITVYHPMPLVVNGVAVADVNAQTEHEKRFEAYMQDMRNRYASYAVPVSDHFLVGFPGERIGEYALDESAFLIVMATTGDGAMKRWFGSISTAVMKQSDIPVLLVPPGTEPGMIRRIVYADDFSANHDTGLAYLKMLETEFLADIYCVHVDRNGVQDENWMNISAITNRFKGIVVSRKIIESEDVVEGITNFCSEMNIDLVIFPSEKKGFIYNLFHTSRSRKMAIETSSPLLIIH